MEEMSAPTQPKYAVVTLVMESEAYVPGALVLARSLDTSRTKEKGDVESVCMIDDKITDGSEALAALQSVFDHVVRIDDYLQVNKNDLKIGHDVNDKIIWTKLNAGNEMTHAIYKYFKYYKKNMDYLEWFDKGFTKYKTLLVGIEGGPLKHTQSGKSIPNYDKVLFIDADMVVLRSIRHLFDLPAPAGNFRSQPMMEAHGLRIPEYIMNQGLGENGHPISGSIWLVHPNEKDYEGLEKLVKNYGKITTDGIVTGGGPLELLLTLYYYRDWTQIHRGYSINYEKVEMQRDTIRQGDDDDKKIILKKDFYVMDYLGSKPWMNKYEPFANDDGAIAEWKKGILQDFTKFYGELKNKGNVTYKNPHSPIRTVFKEVVEKGSGSVASFESDLNAFLDNTTNRPETVLTKMTEIFKADQYSYTKTWADFNEWSYFMLKLMNDKGTCFTSLKKHMGKHPSAHFTLFYKAFINGLLGEDISKIDLPPGGSRPSVDWNTIKSALKAKETESSTSSTGPTSSEEPSSTSTKIQECSTSLNKIGETETLVIPVRACLYDNPTKALSSSNQRVIAFNKDLTQLDGEIVRTDPSDIDPSVAYTTAKTQKDNIYCSGFDQIPDCILEIDQNKFNSLISTQSLPPHFITPKQTGGENTYVNVYLSELLAKLPLDKSKLVYINGPRYYGSDVPTSSTLDTFIKSKVTSGGSIYNILREEGIIRFKDEKKCSKQSKK